MALLPALGSLAGCGGTDIRPENEDPEVVTLEASLGNRFVPAGQSAEVVTELRISTRPMSRSSRPPINLALVIDTSGSMEGRPIEDARAASLALLSTLEQGDRLAVVAFHSETEVLLPSTEIESSHLAELREQIGEMTAQGTTDLQGGLQAGLEEVMRHLDPSGINRVVLLGDGVPNEASMVESLAQAAGERGVAITALGLGLDYDETLLGRVAQLSGGRFHYVEDSARVAEVFQSELFRLERIMGRNMVVELVPGPGVEITQVVGHEVQQAQRGVQFTVGDLSEGETQQIIVRMSAPARRAGATVELMDATLHFDDGVQEAGRLRRRVFVGARATDSEEELETGRNPDVERSAGQIMAAAETVDAIRVARNTGDLARAREILDRATRRVEEVAESYGDAQAASQAASIRELTRALPSMAPAAEAPSYGGSAGSSGGAGSYQYQEESAGADSSDSESEEPAPRPAMRPERAIREAHGRAMDVMSAH